MDITFESITKLVTDMGPAPQCFLVVYGVGAMFNKTPKLNSDYAGYIMVLISGILYSMIGPALENVRNPVANLFVSGLGIGILAWIAHYYQDRIPLLRKFFPDNASTSNLRYKLKQQQPKHDKPV